MFTLRSSRPGWKRIDKVSDPRQEGPVIIPPLDFTRPLDAAIEAVRNAGRQPVALSMGKHRRDQLTAVMAKARCRCVRYLSRVANPRGDGGSIDRRGHRRRRPRAPGLICGISRPAQPPENLLRAA